MTRHAAGWDSIKVWSEAAHMADSLTLLQITGADLMHSQSRLFLERAGSTSTLHEPNLTD